jgi:hypothetical protein
VDPAPEDVRWGFDKEVLCPADDVQAVFCTSFGAPQLPRFDSVFIFDEGTFESFDGEDLGPFVVPAGAAGITLTLADNTVDSDGTLTRVSVALLGLTGAGETELELVVNVNGAPDEVVAPFSAAGTNVEVILPLSVPVLAGDTVEVRLRAQSQLAFNPGWSQILVKLSNGVVWQFDVPLSPGVYCGLRTLAES